MNITSDINKGICICRPEPIDEIATIAVTGLGRSGTTMIARVLTELGLYTGDRLTPLSHEDKTIQILIKANNFTGFEQLCRERDSKYTRWGFKCPALRSNLVKWGSIIRNPRFIIVFRDILAISLRNNISIQTEVIDDLTRAARDYIHMVEQIVKCRTPVLLISYEKALQYPEETVSAIAEFCGFPIDEASIGRIAKIIENGDARYLVGTVKKINT